MVIIKKSKNCSVSNGVISGRKVRFSGMDAEVRRQSGIKLKAKGPGRTSSVGNTFVEPRDASYLVMHAWMGNANEELLSKFNVNEGSRDPDLEEEFVADYELMIDDGLAESGGTLPENAVRPRVEPSSDRFIGKARTTEELAAIKDKVVRGAPEFSGCYSTSELDSSFSELRVRVDSNEWGLGVSNAELLAAASVALTRFASFVNSSPRTHTVVGESVFDMDELSAYAYYEELINYSGRYLCDDDDLSVDKMVSDHPLWQVEGVEMTSSSVVNDHQMYVAMINGMILRKVCLIGSFLSRKGQGLAFISEPRAAISTMLKDISSTGGFNLLTFVLMCEYGLFEDILDASAKPPTGWKFSSVLKRVIGCVDGNNVNASVDAVMVLTPTERAAFIKTCTKYLVEVTRIPGWKKAIDEDVDWAKVYGQASDLLCSDSYRDIRFDCRFKNCIHFLVPAASKNDVDLSVAIVSTSTIPSTLTSHELVWLSPDTSILANISEGVGSLAPLAMAAVPYFEFNLRSNTRDIDIHNQHVNDMAHDGYAIKFSDGAPRMSNQTLKFNEAPRVRIASRFDPINGGTAVDLSGVSANEDILRFYPELKGEVVASMWNLPFLRAIPSAILALMAEDLGFRVVLAHGCDSPMKIPVVCKPKVTWFLDNATPTDLLPLPVSYLPIKRVFGMRHPMSLQSMLTMVHSQTIDSIVFQEDILSDDKTGLMKDYSLPDMPLIFLDCDTSGNETVKGNFGVPTNTLCPGMTSFMLTKFFNLQSRDNQPDAWDYYKPSGREPLFKKPFGEGLDHFVFKWFNRWPTVRNGRKHPIATIRENPILVNRMIFATRRLMKFNVADTNRFIAAPTVKFFSIYDARISQQIITVSNGSVKRKEISTGPFRSAPGSHEYHFHEYPFSILTSRVGCKSRWSLIWSSGPYKNRCVLPPPIIPHVINLAMGGGDGVHGRLFNAAPLSDDIALDGLQFTRSRVVPVALHVHSDGSDRMHARVGVVRVVKSYKIEDAKRAGLERVPIPEGLALNGSEDYDLCRYGTCGTLCTNDIFQEFLVWQPTILCSQRSKEFAFQGSKLYGKDIGSESVTYGDGSTLIADATVDASSLIDASILRKISMLPRWWVFGRVNARFNIGFGRDRWVVDGFCMDKKNADEFLRMCGESPDDCEIDGDKVRSVADSIMNSFLSELEDAILKITSNEWSCVASFPREVVME